MTQPGPVVGIDVAKAELVVAVRPGDARWRVPNDARGLARLRVRLRHLAPALVVLEATGGYERALSPPSRRPSCRSWWPSPRLRCHRSHRRRHPRAAERVRPTPRGSMPLRRRRQLVGMLGAASARARGGPRPAGATTSAGERQLGGRSGPRRLDPAEPRLAREGRPALGAGRRPIVSRTLLGELPELGS